MESHAWERAYDVDVPADDPGRSDAEDQAASADSGGENDFDNLMQRRV